MVYNSNSTQSTIYIQNKLNKLHKNIVLNNYIVQKLINEQKYFS
jgi:hypothetical protein